MAHNYERMTLIEDGYNSISIISRSTTTHVSESVASYIVQKILSPIVKKSYQKMLQRKLEMQGGQNYDEISLSYKLQAYHASYMHVLLTCDRCTMEELLSWWKLQQKQQQEHQEQELQDHERTATTTTPIPTLAATAAVGTASTATTSCFSATTGNSNCSRNTTTATGTTSTSTSTTTTTTTGIRPVIEKYIIRRLSHTSHPFTCTSTTKNIITCYTGSCKCTCCGSTSGGLSMIQVPYLMNIFRVVMPYYVQYPKAPNDVVQFIQRSSIVSLIGKKNIILLIQYFFDNHRNNNSNKYSNNDMATVKGSIAINDDEFITFIEKKQLQKDETMINHSSSIQNSNSNVAAIKYNASSSSSSVIQKPHSTVTATAAVKAKVPSSTTVKQTPKPLNVLPPAQVQPLVGKNISSNGCTTIDDTSDNEEQTLLRPKTPHEEELVTNILKKMNSRITTPQQQHLPYHLLTTPAANYYNLIAQSNDTNLVSSQEILSSYRKLVRKRRNAINQSGLGSYIAKVSEEDVIRDIIRHREEREDAKQMDYARLLSEQTRKDESKRRRDQIQQEFIQSIEQCTNIEYLLDPNDKRLFSTSWILQDKTIYEFVQQQLQTDATKQNHATTDTSFKKTATSKSTDSCNDKASKLDTTSPSTFRMLLVSLLQLEKNAVKWYGTVLPKSYFMYRVIERMNSAIILDIEEPRTITPASSSTKIIDQTHYTREQIQSEIQALNDMMYNLSSQVGGVPKTFRDAHDQYKLKVKTTKELQAASSLSSSSATIESPRKKQKIAMSDNIVPPPPTSSTTPAPEGDTSHTFIDLCESDDENDLENTNSHSKQKEYSRLVTPPANDLPVIEKVVPATSITTSPQQQRRLLDDVSPLVVLQ